MNQNMVNGIMRAVLAALGGVLGAKGVTEAETWAQVSGAIVILVTAVWSVIEKKKITLPPAAPLIALALAGSLMSSGCASIIATSMHDNNVRTQASVIRAQTVAGGTGVGVGVDLLGLNTGYFASWKDNPGMMAGATGLDLLGTLGAAWAATKQSGGSSGPSISINGNGNQISTGDNSPVSRSKTTTTTGQ